MESGWNLWVWLVGVVRVYRCGYPNSNCISSFMRLHPYFLVHFMFFRFCLLFLCNIVNIAQRTFEIVQRLRSCQHGDIIISTSMLTTSLETSTCEIPVTFYGCCELTLCTIMAS